MGTGGSPGGRSHRRSHAMPERRRSRAELVLTRPSDEERLREMGIERRRAHLPNRGSGPGHSNVIFAAAGVTDGTLLQGVRFFGDGIRSPLPRDDHEPPARSASSTRSTSRTIRNAVDSLLSPLWPNPFDSPSSGRRWMASLTSVVRGGFGGSCDVLCPPGAVNGPLGGFGDGPFRGGTEH